jgi:hypothetical protein
MKKLKDELNRLDPDQTASSLVDFEKMPYLVSFQPCQLEEVFQVKQYQTSVMLEGLRYVYVIHPTIQNLGPC